MISGESGYRRPQRLRRDKTGTKIGEAAPPSKDGFVRKAERVKTAPAQVRMVREGDNPWYEVTLMEGKNRQIRRMFEEIGHHVEKIKRVRYGPLSLDVPPGEYRRLSVEELEKLKTGSGGATLGPVGRSEKKFHPKKMRSPATSKTFNRKDRKGRKEKR